MNCALVTGGSRGIGRAICIKLAAMGYYVLVNYKGNETEAANTIALVKEKGGDGELLQFDVARKEDIQEKVRKKLNVDDLHTVDRIYMEADGVISLVKK